MGLRLACRARGLRGGNTRKQVGQHRGQGGVALLQAGVVSLELAERLLDGGQRGGREQSVPVDPRRLLGRRDLDERARDGPRGGRRWPVRFAIVGAGPPTALSAARGRIERFSAVSCILWGRRSGRTDLSAWGGLWRQHARAEDRKSVV